jgi:hypothetical protein
VKVTRAYFEKKLENKKKIYLFKNGAFYLVLNDDALLLKDDGIKNKIIAFGNYDIKMGFPVSEREKIEKILNEDRIEYEFVEDFEPEDYTQYIRT